MGASRSSQASTTTNTSRTNNQQLASESGAVVGVGGDNNTINITDGGAFKTVESIGAGAFNIVAGAIDATRQNNSEIIRAAQENSSKTAAAFQSASQIAAGRDPDILRNNLPYIIAGVVIVFGAMFLRGSKT